MAHQFETGFFVETPPWHGLGTMLPDAPQTSAEAIRAASMDWLVTKEPMEAIVPVNGTYRAVHVPDQYAVIRRRNENGLTRVDALGVVGRQYHPVQNADAFRFFDRVVDSGQVQFHTAGSLREGRLIWILARLNGTLRITEDDLVDKYLLLSNSHDGSSPVSIQMTPIRVVCANTLNLAMDRAGDRRLSIRHTAGAVARIQDVGDWLAGINRAFDDSADAWRILARRSIRAWEMIDYLQTLFPDPTEDAKRNCARATREKILDRFEAGIGTDFTRATWWRLYNAVVEYIDHDRNSGNPDARVTSAWFGQGMQLKEKALSTALQMAA